jgi:hypothetical protein
METNFQAPIWRQYGGLPAAARDLIARETVLRHAKHAPGTVPPMEGS